jgi:hypothetical protein
VTHFIDTVAQLLPPRTDRALLEIGRDNLHCS